MTLTMTGRSWRMWLAVGSMVFAVLLVISAAAMLLWPQETTPGKRKPAGTTPAVSLEALPVGKGYAVKVLEEFQAAPTLTIKVIDPKHHHPYPVPVMLFRDKSGEVRAFYQRDPRSGCLFPWIEAEQLFIDPCHGSAYRSTGERVWGPSPRGLDQFGVVITKDGWITIDLQDYRLGPS